MGEILVKRPLKRPPTHPGDIDDDGLNDLVVLGSKKQAMVLIHSHNMMGTFNPPYPL